MLILQQSDADGLTGREHRTTKWTVNEASTWRSGEYVRRSCRAWSRGSIRTSSGNTTALWFIDRHWVEVYLKTTNNVLISCKTICVVRPISNHRRRCSSWM